MGSSFAWWSSVHFMENTPPPGPTGSGPGSPWVGVGDGVGSGEGLPDGVGSGEGLPDGVGSGEGLPDGVGVVDGLGERLGLKLELGPAVGDGIGVWPSSAPTLRSRSDTRHSNALSAVSPNELKIRTTPTMTSVFDLCFRRCLPLKLSPPKTRHPARNDRGERKPAKRRVSDTRAHRSSVGRTAYVRHPSLVLGHTSWIGKPDRRNSVRPSTRVCTKEIGSFTTSRRRAADAGSTPSPSPGRARRRPRRSAPFR